MARNNHKPQSSDGFLLTPSTIHWWNKQLLLLKSQSVYVILSCLLISNCFFYLNQSPYSHCSFNPITVNQNHPNFGPLIPSSIIIHPSSYHFVPCRGARGVGVQVESLRIFSRRVGQVSRNPEAQPGSRRGAPQDFSGKSDRFRPEKNMENKKSYKASINRSNVWNMTFGT